MERLQATLRLGCPVRFNDAWMGRLDALEVDETWSVVNAVLSHRPFLVRAVRVKLPFSIASDWSDDAISMDCTSVDAFARRLPPVPIQATPLSEKTGVPGANARLFGTLVDRASRRVAGLVLRRGVLNSDMRVATIDEVALMNGALQLAVRFDSLPRYLRDSDLTLIVRDALARHRYLTGDDRRALDVEVVGGVVHLTGNVRTPQAASYAEEAARAVPGVTAARNDVHDDHQLETDIARAIDAAGLYRYGRVYVRSSLGLVTLGGVVAAHRVAEDITRIASQVPGVRSVVSRMEVGPKTEGRAGSAPPLGQPEPLAPEPAVTP